MGFNIEKSLASNANILQLQGQRTVLLASNLANLNTPGYQARDVDLEQGFAQGSIWSDLAGFGNDGFTSLYRYRVPNHMGQDGNTVELGVEQAAFAENAAAFQMSLTFLNMKIKGLTSAISGTF